MTAYQSKDGNIVMGDTPAEVVRHLWVGSFSSATTVTEYMTYAANNIRVIFGLKVGTDTPENFLSDLLAHRLLVAVPLPYTLKDDNK